MANAVSFLVYGGMKPGRRKNSSYDWSGNAGAYVVIDCLRRAGIDVGFCSPETAHRSRVVLVSLCSTYDVYNLIRAVGGLSTWRKRDFVVVCGGFGLQNVYPLRRYVDVACFGRAEGYVIPLVRSLLSSSDGYEHSSVMRLPDVSPVKLSQAEQLYPHRLPIQPIAFVEREVGCPRRCLFCHYTFSRRYVTAHEEAFTGNLGWTSREVLFDRILDDCNRKTKVRTALDGMSQRLRYAFNKRLSNGLIIETIERLSSEWKGKSPWITVYQIGSYPTETEADREEFAETVNRAKPKGKKVFLDVHVTPFRPSPLTPSAYLPVDLNVNWHNRSLTNIAHQPLLESYYMACQESPYPHLLSVIAERAGEHSDDLIDIICHSRKLKRLSVTDRVKALSDTIDLTPYLREYSTSELLPTWYLESYTPNTRLASMADVLKRRLGLGPASS